MTSPPHSAPAPPGADPGDHTGAHPGAHPPPPGAARPATPGLHARLRRIVVLLGCVLLALYLLYLLAGNVFLNTAIGPSTVNRKPAAFQMHWGSGWTWWPGRVVLSDVHLQGHVRKTLWSVRATQAHGAIALLPLLRRELRVPWVDASQVHAEIVEADTERAVPAARPGGWLLRFDRISSDSLREARLGDWHLDGEGHASVAFDKRLRGGPMTLYPSTVEFGQARLALDGKMLMQDARIASTFSMDRHIAREVRGLDKLSLLQASLELDGTGVALEASHDADTGYRFAAVPGNGRVQGALSLVRGRLAPGGSLHLHAPLAAVDPAGRRIDNTLDARISVDNDIRLTALVPAVDGKHLSLDADLRVAGNALPLGDWRARLSGVSGHLKGQWHFPSLDWVSGLFVQADWLNLAGRGVVDMDLQIAQGKLADGSRLSVPQVEASANVMGSHVRGSGQMLAVIGPADDGVSATRLDLKLDSFGIAPADAPARPYVTGRDLRLELTAGNELATLRDSLRGQVRFRDARVPDLRAYNRYLPSQALRFTGGSGTLTGDLRIDGEGELGEGRLQVRGPRTELVAAGVQMRGDVAIDARLRRGDLQARHFSLGGSTVQLRNVGFTEADGSTRDGWWATLQMPSGDVRWAKRNHVGARLDARMKDVGFLLALFSDRAGYPAWIGKLVDAGQARLQGRLQWQDDTLVLDRMHATNDRFQVDGRFRLRGEQRHGDLYAKWGVLGAGVEINGGQRRMHLKGAREWFDSRPHYLRD